MKNWQPFNLNQQVRFKLTDEGRKILMHHWGRTAEIMDEPASATVTRVVPEWQTPGAWVEMQLWRMMEIFGAYLHNGVGGPIETNIEFEVQK